MGAFDIFRDKTRVRTLLEEIRKRSFKKIRLMEVCGGHTMAIHRYGIPALLPKNIVLKSGPGCPVCVSAQRYIDQAIAYSRLDGIILTTFGDLMRVPGSTSSLEKERANGRDVRVVYSSINALQIARQNPDKKVVFLGIGFETTAPTTAAILLKAVELNIRNFLIFSAHKIMPPVMETIVEGGVHIDGFIGPGHVSTITGSDIFLSLPQKYGVGCVISGFEPVDLLASVLMLIDQKLERRPQVEIEYTRAVKKEGNLKAQKMMEEVFLLRDDYWRGIGVIPKSGLKIRKAYAEWDAEEVLDVEVERTRENSECICGDILKGRKTPKHCPLFKKECTPGDPVGACMVSTEGACHAYYLYGNGTRK